MSRKPFYVIGKGFVEAKDLKVSDILLKSNGVQVSIDSIEIEKLKEAETTYNFEVADFHTYFVTENNILVHNMCIEENADYYVKYIENDRPYKAFHQKTGDYKGMFLAKDDYGHANSAYKLLKKVQGNKLKLIGDIDINGKLMIAKHSSNANNYYLYFGRKFL